MSIAIIGSGGYLGEKLSQYLIELGENVTKISSKDDFGISQSTGIFSKELVFPGNVETVFYLAQSPYYRQMPMKSSHLVSVNCVSAIQAAEAARIAGVKNFVYASTGNVYSPSFLELSEDSPLNRENWYSLSKIMAEDTLNLYSKYFNLTIVRVFGIFGPGQKDKLIPNLTNTILNGMEIALERNPTNPNDTDGIRISYIYIQDVINLFKTIYETSYSGIVNIAGTEAISIRELAGSIGKELHISPKFVISDVYRKGNLIANIDKQSLYLGKPSVAFNEGLKIYLDGVKRLESL